MKRFFTNLLLSLAAVAAGLLLANVIYAQMEPKQDKNRFLGSTYTFFQYDPVFGWSNRPGGSGIFKRTEFTTHVKINSQGMRDREVGPKTGFRVAVMGDSFAWGHGVEGDEIFTRILDEKSGAEVINFSVAAYGLLQFYLKMDEIATYQPDLLVMTIFIGNDINDSISNYLEYYRPYARLKDGKLDITGYPIPDIRRFDRQIHSTLIQYALGRLLVKTFAPSRGTLGWANWLKSSSHPPEEEAPREGFPKTPTPTLYNEPHLPDSQKITAIAEALLQAIQAKADAQGIPLVMLFIPVKDELANPATLDFLQSLTRRAGIRLETGLQNRLTSEDYFVMDGHWRVSGHRKAAEVLMPVISAYKDKAKQQQGMR